LVPSQDKATGTRAWELNKASRHELSAAALWIEQGAHRLSHVLRRLSAVLGKWRTDHRQATETP
jgi:hypothetical protein